MKTTKFYLLPMMIFLSAANAFAQDDSRKIGYAAYMRNALPLWEKAIETQKKVLSTDQSKKTELQLSVLYYGYLSATMATQDEASFDVKIYEAISQLEGLMKKNPNWGEPKAIMSSVMGLQIAYSPIKGATLGFKSSSYMSKALKESPESPIVMKLHAGSKQYTPALWGGDKKEALEYYQKCIDVYEKQGDSQQNWFYADALANMGIIYTDLGQNTNAVAVFEKALAYEPDFAWVKMSLLPKAQN